MPGNKAYSVAETALEGCFGGAIYSINGTITVLNSTLTNSVARTGRALYVLARDGTATIDIQSSIMGQSDMTISMREFSPTPDVNGVLVVTGSNNLIRVQNNYEFITTSTADPMLGPLVANGGPTLTHALGEDSPAIDAGNNSQSLSADQRGGDFERVIGPSADMGAYEVQTAIAPEVPGDYNRDDIVDAADFVLWRRTSGSAVPKYSGADGNGNGEVDIGDYGVWRSHFGETPPGGAAAQVTPAGAAETENVVGDTGPRIEAGGSRGVLISFVMSLPSNASPSDARGVLAAVAAGNGVGFQEPGQDLLLLHLAKVAYESSGILDSSTTDVSDASSGSDVEEVADAVFGEWPAVFAQDSHSLGD